MFLSYSIVRAEQAAQVQAAVATLWTTFEREELPLTTAEANAVLARPNFHLFLAENASGKVLGVASVQVMLGSDFRSLEAMLWDLAVLPEYHRQGIGRALVDHVRQWAVDQGFGEAFVMADGDDVEALAFYRHLDRAAEAEVRLYTLMGQ